MDYKEKYEQAIENFKKIKAANKENKELVDFIEYKYPELKDGCDERIRKAILELVKQSSHVLNPMNQKSMIAWLEKQGGQKPTWSEEDEIELCTIINFLKNPSTAKSCPTLRSNAIDWLKSIKDRVQPKQECSDEDKKMYDMLCSMVHGTFVVQTQEALDELLSWLKSLKERMKGEYYEMDTSRN